MWHAAVVLRLLISAFRALPTPWQYCRYCGLGLFYLTYIYRPLPDRTYTFYNSSAVAVRTNVRSQQRDLQVYRPKKGNGKGTR